MVPSKGTFRSRPPFFFFGRGVLECPSKGAVKDLDFFDPPPPPPRRARAGGTCFFSPERARLIGQKIVSTGVGPAQAGGAWRTFATKWCAGHKERPSARARFRRETRSLLGLSPTLRHFGISCETGNHPRPEHKVESG